MKYIQYVQLEQRYFSTFEADSVKKTNGRKFKVSRQVCTTYVLLIAQGIMGLFEVSFC